MTAKEKAAELVEKYSIWEDESGMGWNINCEKQCALIAVDEIIKILSSGLDFEMIKSLSYWQEAKEEIEKL